MGETTGRRRAPAMDPEQRRAMIVSAALPLVVEYGPLVTTAKIARAAGIGEGTIFRVFTDKEALLAACMDEALRPDDTVAHLEGISLDQPLAARLTEAAEVLRGYMNRIGDVAGALASLGKATRPPGPGAKGMEEGQRQREAGLAAPRAALAALLEPDREVLRLAPERLAEIFQLMLMSAGRSPSPEPLGDAELVDLFLHGALAGQSAEPGAEG
ncbi:TetR/AcrR family transcriptional regulator [Streptomyces sp. 891-h]|uniref:TetR/AcrR family transcriptional regulator n=1 Tax=Streptomyces sp. 891-h TaxID=2720714 RepID=UPI001FAA250E|nr:TetR/AcrR family transcriptional regulator [Streptomyces sp. 891-h]UNZ20410.1 TetR/AcrR family transcriptional regulator [Streptomyces sp. 891-h]